MVFEGAFAPNDKIGAGYLFSHWHLGSNAGIDLRPGPVPDQEALATGSFRTGDTNNLVKMCLSTSFVQERNDDDGDRAIFPFPGFDLGEPSLPDPRMKNLFESLPGGGILEDDISEFIPAKLAILGNNFIPECDLNFGKGRLAGLDEFTPPVNPMRFILPTASGPGRNGSGSQA
jgi:hypothetical protein